MLAGLIIGYWLFASGNLQRGGGFGRAKWEGKGECGKTLIPSFWDFFASVGKIFILEGALGAGLSFCGV